MLNTSNTISDRKGIYKDLYKALDAEKDKKKTQDKNFSARVPRGIYKDIYSGIEKAGIKAKNKENIWHKYPLKLLVYSNDFGEALRPVLGNLAAKLSWIPAIFYTICAILKGEEKDKSKEFLFQGIASFLLPFLLLKTSRKAAQTLIDSLPSSFKQKIKTEGAKLGLLHKFIDKFKRKDSCGYRNLALSTVGVGAITLGAKPIDNAVKSLMENRFTKNAPIQ